MKITSSPQTALNNIQMELTGGPSGDPTDGIGKNGAPLDERGKVKELANQFESLFLGIVLKSMRDSVQKSKLIDGGNAEEIYGSMLDGEYSKQMAEQRHTGIADNIERFMLQAMDAQEKVKTDMAKVQGLAAYGKAQDNYVEAAAEAPAPSAAPAAGRGLSAWTSGLIRATIGNGTTPLDQANSAAVPRSVPSPAKVLE